MAKTNVEQSDNDDSLTGKAFRFTEARCRQALQAAVDGATRGDGAGEGAVL